jgi:ribosome-binding protein aMBF1 (putative translation factor)
MERLSGMRKPSINKEQSIVRANFSKLRMPEPKQTNPDIIDNYYWELNIARRRKKMTVNQLSKETQIPVEIIELIEKGQIPENYETLFRTLEDYFGIKLLKKHEQKITYTLNTDDENKIIEKVRNKIENKENNENNTIKKIKINKLRNGEIDFSRKEDIKNITLNDLVELKRKKEKEETRKKIEKQTEDLFGDDIEFM